MMRQAHRPGDNVVKDERGKVTSYRCGRCGDWVEVRVSVLATMIDHTWDCFGVFQRCLSARERARITWSMK
jgi:hypothetical protein